MFATSIFDLFKEALMVMPLLGALSTTDNSCTDRLRKRPGSHLYDRSVILFKQVNRVISKILKWGLAVCKSRAAASATGGVCAP